MSNGTVVFFLNDQPQIDHIGPVIYKLGERGTFPIHVCLGADVAVSDYRISFLDQFECITIHACGDDDSGSQSVSSRVVGAVKAAGRRLPSDIPNKIYNRVSTDSPNRIHLPDIAVEYDTVIVGMDWNAASSTVGIDVSDDTRVESVVFPHGDSPYYNALANPDHFRALLADPSVFEKSIDLFEIAFSEYEDMADKDYFLFPNELTANRLRPFVEESRIEVLGSPRFNDEWIDVVSDIRPASTDLPDGSSRVVVFSQKPALSINKREVIQTLELVSRFPETRVVVKPHPRENLLNPNEVAYISGVEVCGDETDSATLIEWGDLFLTLGTSISFEPVMRDIPVFALEYAHSNHTTIAHYLTVADIRSKDELYEKLHSVPMADETRFYDIHEKATFVDEIITAGHSSVLDSYADFVESLLP